MTRRRVILWILFLLVVPATTWVVADQLGILRTPDGTVERGITMEQVRQDKGEPVEVVGPVGDPPITRWVFEDEEIVVFEYDRVVDSFYRRE